MRGTFSLLTICIVLAAVGCQKADETSSISSGLEHRNNITGTASDTQKSSAVVQALENDAAKNLESIAAKSLPETAPELMQTLAQLEIEQLREVDPTKSLLVQKRRAIASERLLKLNPSIEQQREVIRMHLDALTKLSRVRDPNVVKQFNAFTQKWNSNPDAKIAQTVDLARLTFDYAAQQRRERPDLTFVVQSVSEIANRYANDPSVFNQLIRLSQDTLQQGDTESWRQMTQSLVAVYGSSSQPGLRNAVSRLQKQMDAYGNNLHQIARQIVSGDEGAFVEMQVALQVLLDSDLTAENLQLIGRTLLWLEANATVQQTKRTNSMVEGLCRTSQPAQLRMMLQKNCQLRNTRLNLVGREFVLAANSARGGVLNWHTVSNGRRTMVAFWSTDDAKSIQFVKHLAKLYETYQEQNIQLVAVNVTRDAKAASAFGKQLPSWEIAMAASDRSSFAQNVSTAAFTQPDSRLIEDYGIETLPQLITVDANGKVVQVNPAQDQLKRFLRDGQQRP